MKEYFCFLFTREVILTSVERILTTFYFFIHADCFMSDPLVRQSSVNFIDTTDQHNV